MDELNPFEDIAPYNDEEAAAALSKLAEHPNVPWISKYIFSNQPETYLRDILRSISTVDDFQKLVMSIPSFVRPCRWAIHTELFPVVMLSRIYLDRTCEDR